MSCSIETLKLIFHYWFFSKATLLVLGLVFGYKIIEHSIMNLLIDILSYAWEETALIYKVAIVNAVEGLSDIMVLVLACLADNLTGRYVMVIISATFYLLGLLPYLIFDQSMGTLMVLLSVPLLAIGQGGGYNLTEFLANQLSSRTDNYEHIKVRKNIWLFLAWLCSILLLYFYFNGVSWPLNFVITIHILVISLFFFLTGGTIYIHEEKTGSPAYTIYTVLKASLLGRNPPLSEEVEDVNRLLALTPIFLSFFLYCFAKAAGSTFFIEQTSNMESEQYALYALIIIQLCSRFLTSIFSKLYMRFWEQGSPSRICLSLHKGGAGISYSFICCLVAYIVESIRQQLIQKYGVDINEKDIIPMNAFWLSPQFVLLGSMTELSQRELEYLMYSQLKTEKMKTYTEPFASAIFGIGKLLSVLWVFCWKKWFNTTVNNSSLHKYYMVLSFVSFANIFLFNLLLKRFGRTGYVQDDETGSQSQNEADIIEGSHQITESQIELGESYPTPLSWFRSRSAPNNEQIPLVRLDNKSFIRSHTTLGKN